MKKLAFLICVALLSCSKEKEQCYECTTRYTTATRAREEKSTQCNMTEEGIKHYENSATQEINTSEGKTTIVTTCKL